MTAGKIAAIASGILGVLIGAGATAGTTSILVEDRDADDFFISSEQHLERSSFAIASEDVDVLTDAPGWLTDWLIDPVDVRVRGVSGDGGAIFFGIAESSDRDANLAGVNYDEVTNIDLEGSDITYRTHEGTVPSPPVPKGCGSPRLKAPESRPWIGLCRSETDRSW